MPSVPKTLHMRSGSQPCVQLASSFRIGVRLSACALAALLSPCVLAAQAQSETVGRIEGDAIAVKGAVGVEVENGRSITLLASGSQITVKSGQARVTLAEGGEIGICGPAHLSLLKSGNTVTVALDYGRVHAKLDRAVPLTVYTPLIVATPVAIGDAPRDATVGFEASGTMCVLASRGAVRLEQQLTGQVLLVPQAGEVALAEGQLDSLRETSGSCQCEVQLARAAPPGSKPTEISVPVSADLAKAVKPPEKSARPDPKEEMKPPVIEEPIYKVLMPALTFSAASPNPPPDPSPQVILLVRRVRVRPVTVYRGHVKAPPPPPPPPVLAATITPTPAPPAPAASPPPAPPKPQLGLVARMKDFFRKLW